MSDYRAKRVETVELWQNEIAIVVNDYQRVNLLALFEACGYPNLSVNDPWPLTNLQTGDWMGELYWKVLGSDSVKTRMKPNVTAEENLARVRELIDEAQP